MLHKIAVALLTIAEIFKRLVVLTVLMVFVVSTQLRLHYCNIAQL